MIESDFGDILASSKDDVIQSILTEEDLYKILGAQRSASGAELRRCYLERSKICHPDRIPFHPLSTRAFQRLAFSFEILKSPSSRRSYDSATSLSSISTTASLPTKHPSPPLASDNLFRTTVSSLIHDFLTGDFITIRSLLSSLNTQYPHLINTDVTSSIEVAFIKVRELVMRGRVWALLIYIEMGRIWRVQKRLRELGRWDLVGKARMMLLLVRVVVAVPVRVDRALKARVEKERRRMKTGSETNKLDERLDSEDELARGGILNERVCKVLEFIVGEAGNDEEGEDNGVRI
ncbi:LysM domain-containing protein [Botrytis cinerea]